MIKLLGIDLDGTLLYPKRRFSIMTRKNANFLKEFIAQGGKVVLVSGRNPMMKSKIEKKIGHPVSLLGCNGSFLVEGNQVVQGNPMPNDILLQIYSKLRKNFGIISWLLFDASDRMHLVTHGVSGAFVALAKFINSLSFQYRETFVYGEKEFIKALQTGVNYKIMPVFGIGKKAKERALQAFIAVNDLYQDKVTICASNNALEISAINTNKAQALLNYIQKENISPDEVAVIGDSGNDIIMFEAFKNSFVMDHADSHVACHAKYKIHRVSDVKKFIGEL